MNLLVAGSRTLDDPFVVMSLLEGAVCALPDFGYISDVVVHGGARGVDTLAGDWAVDNGYEVHVMPAQWDEFGRSAGYRRNAEMVAIADAAVFLWDGESRGTQHSIDLVRAKGIRYVLIEVPSA